MRACLMGADTPREESVPVYPRSRTERVVETLHGIEIVDPYRWLENSASPEVGQWIDDQNRLTETALHGRPARRTIEERLEELLAVGMLTTPAVRDRHYFYLKREWMQKQ